MSGSSNNQSFPNLQSKVVDKDGNITIIWRNFLFSLWNRTGGAVSANFASLNGSTTQVFNVAPATTSTEAPTLGQLETGYAPISGSTNYAAIAGSSSQVFNASTALTGTQVTPLSQVNSLISTAQQTQGAAISAVSVGASPFAYTAAARGALAVSGGTVSAISMTRGGTTIPLGVLAGLFQVTNGDKITITYSVAPTVNFAPS